MRRAMRRLFLLLTIAAMMIASYAFALTAEQNTANRYIRAGMEQMKANDYKSARDSFEQAIRYDDLSPAAHLGLGMAFFHLRDDTYAERELTRAVEINPKEAAAFQFLGELYYRKDDLETAASYWEKAVELNPSAENLCARLDRIRKEHKAEKDFKRDVTSHFLTKYEGREKIEAGKIVLRILEDAYGEVGRALNYYPDVEIQVILYSGQQFQEVTDAPGWSGGIYDGKIRMPIGGIEQETPALRKTLYHEYTHAVVRAITPRCPTWLNEGLAQYFEGKQLDSLQKDMLRRLAQTGKIPTLSKLEGPFMGLDSGQAMLAYLFSLSSVRYIVDTYGMYRIRSVLDELAAGATTSAAISAGITTSYEEVERGWKRSLE
jgi:tetratricopeptide (TPR) repeat protein